MTVSPVPPLIAKISANKTSGQAALTVNFSSAGSSGVIGAYYWDFGDDTATSGSTSKTPSHTYTTPGTYTARLMLASVYHQPMSTAAVIINVKPAPSKNTGH
jgi:PKD repeat protein